MTGRHAGPLTWPTRLGAWAARRVPGVISGTGGALTRFPLAVLSFLAVTMIVNAEIAEIRFLDDALLWRLATAGSVGAAVSVGARLTLEGWAATGMVRLVLPVALGLVATLVAIVYRPFEGAGNVMQTAALLLMLVAPFVGRAGSMAFWRFFFRTLASTALAFLAILVFASGMVLVTELFRLLFSIGPSLRVYAHVYATAILLIGPLMALGLLPAPAPDGPSDRLVGFVRPIALWVAVPLSLLGLGVLNLYALRLLVTGEQPADDMLWIVPFTIVNTLSVRLIAHPLDPARPAHLRLFMRFWPLALVVPIALFAWSARIETQAWRWTFEIYYAALVVLAGAVIALLQAHTRTRGDVRSFFVVPGVFLCASLAGPLGAASVVSNGYSAGAPAASRPVVVQSSFHADSWPAMPVGSFDLVLPALRVDTAQTPLADGFVGRLEGRELLLASASGGEARFDLSGVLDAMAGRGDGPALVGELQAGNGRRIAYRVDSARLRDGTPDELSMTLLLRRADWPG